MMKMDTLYHLDPASIEKTISLQGKTRQHLEQTPDQKKARWIAYLNRSAIGITLLAFLIACYCGSQNLGLIDGSFGPGSYYYSDIPGWEKIFLSQSTWHLGFGKPLFAFAFFVIWGIASFRLLLWLDRKLK